MTGRRLVLLLGLGFSLALGSCDKINYRAESQHEIPLGVKELMGQLDRPWDEVYQGLSSYVKMTEHTITSPPNPLYGRFPGEPKHLEGYEVRSFTLPQTEQRRDGTISRLIKYSSNLVKVGEEGQRRASELELQSVHERTDVLAPPDRRVFAEVREFLQAQNGALGEGGIAASIYFDILMLPSEQHVRGLLITADMLGGIEVFDVASKERLTHVGVLGEAFDDKYAERIDEQLLPPLRDQLAVAKASGDKALESKLRTDIEELEDLRIEHTMASYKTANAMIIRTMRLVAQHGGFEQVQEAYTAMVVTSSDQLERLKKGGPAGVAEFYTVRFFKQFAKSDGVSAGFQTTVMKASRSRKEMPLRF